MNASSPVLFILISLSLKDKSQPPPQLPNIGQKAQLNSPLKASAFESRGFLVSLGQEEANFPGLLACLENGGGDRSNSCSLRLL